MDSVCRMKTSNAIWRPFSHFSDDVSEEELNALIQKAIPAKTKIARKYDLKFSKVRKRKKKNVKYQFDSLLDAYSLLYHQHWLFE